MKKRWVAAVLAAILLLVPAAARAEGAAVGPLESELPMEADAVSVLLLDARSGTVILEKNADEQRPAASLTKLMTILLTLEALDEGRISLSDEVTVSETAAGMGGSQAFLDAGGVYPVEDLLKSLIVASANDSAVALAELLSGSEEAFAARMNERAVELGLTGTHYVNASGLPVEGQHTTARDIATLSLAVLTHPQYFAYSTIWMDEIVHKNDRVTDLVNTNRLIRFYEGADGVKTGSTNEAGYCISATAKRGEERFLAVVLGSSTSAKRFALAQELLTYAFDHYETASLLSQGDIVVEGVAVENAAAHTADLAAKEDLSVLARKGESASLTVEWSAPSVLRAPLSAGEIVGEAVAMREGEAVARIPLVLVQDLPARSFLSCVEEVLRLWMPGAAQSSI
ncbi:MAG: D-alanyl-D-alanine carboxypeptidase family protein [Candidatus Spyradocola sp.]|jgi:D-alanyl-D-alanine carboxypeptidase (penicillin-binding protein 5/6)